MSKRKQPEPESASTSETVTSEVDYMKLYMESQKKIKDLEEKNKKQDEELEKGSKFWQYYGGTLPNISLSSRVASSKSRYTSHADEIKKLVLEPACPLLSQAKMQEFADSHEKLNSCIWPWLGFDNCLYYGSENDVTKYVTAVINDVIRLVFPNKVAKEVLVLSELTFGNVRPDVMIVFMNDVPRGVVEVKKPGKGKLDSPRVLGQVYNYIKSLSRIFGVQLLFGIVTTYAEWRICWLPEMQPAVVLSEEQIISMREEDMRAVLAESNASVAGTEVEGVEVELEDPRILHATPILCANDGNVVARNLGIFLLKMALSPVDHPVNWETCIFNKDRCVVQISEATTPCWKLIKEERAISFPEALPNVNTKNFFVVSYLGSGVEGTVWLCCDPNWSAVAIKFYKDLVNGDEKAKKEAALWNTIHKVAARATTLLDSAALIMPYYVPLGLGRTPVKHEQEREHFYSGGELNMTMVMNVMSTEIEKWVEAGYYHDDIMVRNIGVKQSGELILLDMTSAKIENNATTARKCMTEQLNVTPHQFTETPEKK